MIIHTKLKEFRVGSFLKITAICSALYYIIKKTDLCMFYIRLLKILTTNL